MNKHVTDNEGAVAPVLDVADKPVRDDAIFVQDDGNYPVDTLDIPGSEIFTETEEGKG